MHIRIDLMIGSALKFTPFWEENVFSRKSALTFLITKGSFYSSSQGPGAVNSSGVYVRSVVLEIMGKIHVILYYNDYEKSRRRILIYGLYFKNSSVLV